MRAVLLDRRDGDQADELVARTCQPTSLWPGEGRVLEERHVGPPVDCVPAPPQARSKTWLPLSVMTAPSTTSSRVSSVVVATVIHPASRRPTRTFEQPSNRALAGSSPTL